MWYIITACFVSFYLRFVCTMKSGDLVRFAKWEELSASQISKTKHWHLAPKNHIGVLVEHDKLMGSVHILYEGKIFHVRPVFVEKAGKKDIEKHIQQR